MLHKIPLTGSLSVRLVGCRTSPRRCFSLLQATNRSHPRPALRLTHVQARQLSLWPFGRSTPPQTVAADASSSASTTPEDPSAAVTAATSSSVDPSPSAGASPDTAASVSSPATQPIDPSTLDPTAALSTASTTPVETTTDLLTTAASAATQHLAPALQLGDLAALGLANFWPSGIIIQSLEIINVTTHLPWFHTLILGSLFWKLLTLPLNIAGMRNAAKLQPIQGQLSFLQAEMKKAANSKDMLEMQKAQLKMKALYKEAGIDMKTNLLVPVVQIPVMLGAFFGVKKLCELPLAQLLDSGVSFLPNLTVPDPTYILPAIFMVAVNAQIHIGKYEIDTVERPGLGHLMNVFHVLSIFGLWFTSGWPSGLLLYLTSTTVFTSIQSLVLRYKPVREWCGIPEVNTRIGKRVPNFLESMQYGMKMMKDAQDAKRQEIMRERKRR